jgi:hypothetical protein
VAHDRIIEQQDSISCMTDPEAELRLLVGLKVGIERPHTFED